MPLPKSFKQEALEPLSSAIKSGEKQNMEEMRDYGIIKRYEKE